MSTYSYEDIIDVRDIIETVTFNDTDEDTAPLVELLKELKDNGGDVQWNGDWYPNTLIRDSYFTDYARQLAEDIGAINNDAQWPANCIDWERASQELRMDYTSIEYDGTTYWYR